jgi:site-specific recombinase XerC
MSTMDFDQAVALFWKDLDLNTGKLMVRQGKGAKDRTLWLGGHCPSPSLAGASGERT